MIELLVSNGGVPMIALTKGQMELVDAAIKAGVESFTLQATKSMTTMTINTPRRRNGSFVCVHAAWWPNGKFRKCWVDTETFENKEQSLSVAKEALAKFAKKKR